MARTINVLEKRDIVRKICKKYRIANVNAVRTILDEYDNIRKEELLLGHPIREPFGLSRIKRRKTNDVFLTEEQKKNKRSLYTVKVVTDMDEEYRDKLINILNNSDDEDLYK